MADLKHLEFLLVRYAPHALRERSVDIGVLLLERAAGDSVFAKAKFVTDWRAVRCLDPLADTETLESFAREVQAQLGEARDREGLLKWLQESYSNVIQVSAPKGSVGDDPERELDILARIYLESPLKYLPRNTVPRRSQVYRAMRSAFEQASAWAMMRHDIPVAEYTHKGDPLKIDCGYRPNGVMKMFHAVSVLSDVNTAKALAFSFPQIAQGMVQQGGPSASLTAVVEDDLDRKDEGIEFVLSTLGKSNIAVAAVAEMPGLAEAARRELKG